MSKEINLPDSAISTWGGFVYQGKVALYHALVLLNTQNFRGKVIKEFSLQLDSTDDFAIYCNDIVVSTHQVKAKISSYRSAYQSALEKASAIAHDCDDDTARFLHISTPLDNMEDYDPENGYKVEIYTYENIKYCSLQKIDELIKKQVELYLKSKSSPCTEIIKTEKSCYLSEKITKKVLFIHSEIQGGRTQKEAAYSETISSIELVDFLNMKPLHQEDNEYKSIIAKEKFGRIVEEYVYNEINYFTKEQVIKITNAFNFIYNASIDEISRIVMSMRPDESDANINNDYIRNYLDLIAETKNELKLIELPHYSKMHNKYLPTSLTIHSNPRRQELFIRDVQRNISENTILAYLLYEYNNLIVHDSAGLKSINAPSAKITRTDECDIKNHIVRAFDLRILSRQEMELELDAK